MGHHGAGAERHPDDVGLAEEDGADAEERRRFVASVQSHEVHEEREERGAGVGVIQEREEVQHGERGQSQGREYSTRGRTGLERENEI